MSKSYKSRIVAEQFPRPLELEAYTRYINRVTNDKAVRTLFGPTKSRILAEREWIRAKDRSLVSVTTSEGSFLLFGELRKD